MLVSETRMRECCEWGDRKPVVVETDLEGKKVELRGLRRSKHCGVFWELFNRLPGEGPSCAEEHHWRKVKYR